MRTAINSICSKLREALDSDEPEMVRKAITEIGGDETDHGLSSVARYIADAFYAFGLSEDEVQRWDAPHLVLVGQSAKGVEKFEENIRLSFYGGYIIELKPEGGPRLNLSGPVMSPAVALSDGSRVDLIAKYLQRLVDCLRELDDLSTEAVNNQPASVDGEVKPAQREFIDDYLTRDFAERIKPHYILFPKTLKALSRNYYFVPDSWVEYVPNLHVDYDQDAGTISLNRTSLDRLSELRREIEKEIWRISNQPGYLTTEKKLAGIQPHPESITVVAQQDETRNRIGSENQLAIPSGVENSGHQSTTELLDRLDFLRRTFAGCGVRNPIKNVAAIVYGVESHLEAIELFENELKNIGRELAVRALEVGGVQAQHHFHIFVTRGSKYLGSESLALACEQLRTHMLLPPPTITPTVGQITPPADAAIDGDAETDQLLVVPKIVRNASGSFIYWNEDVDGKRIATRFPVTDGTANAFQAMIDHRGLAVGLQPHVGKVHAWLDGLPEGLRSIVDKLGGNKGCRITVFDQAPDVGSK